MPALAPVPCHATIPERRGNLRRGGRAVDRAGLENRRAERPREFESHPLRADPRPKLYIALTTSCCSHQMKIRTPFDWWGALRARVKIPPLRDLNPEPKRSFG